MTKTRTYHVMASVKLDNEWNEWTSLPGFALFCDAATTPEQAARRACMIVHHERTRKVEVQVYNASTKLYDLKFIFDPITI